MGSSCSCISSDSSLVRSNTSNTSNNLPVTVAPASTTQEPSSSISASNPTMSVKPKVAVIYYSTYGHIAKMAAAVVKGVQAAGGDVTLYQIAETLPKDVLEKMHAAPKDEKVPVVQVTDLPNYDALIFGCPTRYGQPAAQFKQLWDQTGGLWQSGALNGKLASFFTGTATLGGGQETTALTTLSHFVHHGMIFIPLGYGNPSLFKIDEVHGGSPWSAGTLSGGDGSRQPSPLELDLATYQGKRVTEFATTFVNGKAK